jgi:hypothetical protein
VNTKDDGKAARGQDGRYDAAHEKVCVCGHTRGTHSERGKACFAGDFSETPAPHGSPDICDCAGFRRSRKAA